MKLLDTLSTAVTTKVNNHTEHYSNWYNHNDNYYSKDLNIGNQHNPENPLPYTNIKVRWKTTAATPTILTKQVN